MKRRKTVSIFIQLLAAFLLIAGLSSCKDPGSSTLAEEALRGQWAVYEFVSATEEETSGEEGNAELGTQETKQLTAIIDIHYTKPGYWFFGSTGEKADLGTIEGLYDIGAPAQLEDGQGYYIKSDRVQKEDGWFAVSFPALPDEEIGGMEIRYRFTDKERNTMEAEVYQEETAGGSEAEENTEPIKCVMERLIDCEIEILPISEAVNFST